MKLELPIICMNVECDTTISGNRYYCYHCFQKGSEEE